MSQHRIEHPLRKGLVLSYGFDRILQYYFASVFDLREEKGCLGPIYNTDQTDMVQRLMDNYDAPLEHKFAVMLDLPIP
jgi:hypothetical protein